MKNGTPILKMLKQSLLVAVILTVSGNTLADQSNIVDHRKVKVFDHGKVNVVRRTSTYSTLRYKIPRHLRNKLQTIQWEMKAGSLGRPILSGNHYQLVNLSNQRGLKRQPRSIAANIGFSKSSKKIFNMKIQRQGGAGQVRYGDRVALNMKPYGWLKYKKQRKGINLSDDNNNPHYIWVIGGGQTGKKLVSGMPFSLYNTKQKKEMVYCKRTWGINLGWHSLSKCGGTASKISNKVFGENGLFSRDGLSGKGFIKLKDYLCDKGIKAGAAYITAQSAGAGAVAVAAIPRATKECKKL